MKKLIVLLTMAGMSALPLEADTETLPSWTYYTADDAENPFPGEAGETETGIRLSGDYLRFCPDGMSVTGADEELLLRERMIIKLFMCICLRVKGDIRFSGEEALIIFR